MSKCTRKKKNKITKSDTYTDYAQNMHIISRTLQHKKQNLYIVYIKCIYSTALWNLTQRV